MPTEIIGQNGAVIKQTTKIAVQGCKKVGSVQAALARAATQTSARRVPQTA